MSVILVFLWRFFTGDFLDGKKINDATFFLDASKTGNPRRRTWWRRKSRFKRLLWRNGITWCALGFTLLCIYSLMLAIVLLLAFSPYLAYVAYHRLRNAMCSPYTYSGADGIARQGWSYKPKVRRFFDRISGRKHKPGILTKERQLESLYGVPPEVAKGMLNEHRKTPATSQPIRLRIVDGEAKSKTEW